MSETDHSLSTSISAPRSRETHRTAWIVLAAVAAVLGAVVVGGVLFYMFRDPPQNSTERISAKVLRGTLPISVAESGEVRAAQRKIISNELRWPVIIEEVAEEGEHVQKGDLIIRFSCQQLEDQIAEDELDVRVAQDNYQAAAGTFDIAQMQAEDALRKAQTAVLDAEKDMEKYMGSEWYLRYKQVLDDLPPSVRVASMPTTTPATSTAPATAPAFMPNAALLAKMLAALREYEGGEWRQERDEAEADISMARGDLKLARDRLESKKKINADPELKQPYSDSEIESDQLNVDRLELKVRKAQTTLNILYKYTHPRKLRDTLTAVADAKLDLVATRVEQLNKVNLARTKMLTSETRLKREEDRLAEYKEDFATKLKYVAEEPGLIVYDTGSSRRFRSSEVTIAVSETIEPRQQLMIIPDMSTLQVETKVYEAVREQIYVGLPVVIRLDARRGEVLSGKVTKVALLPDSQGRWLSSDVKVYPTVVSFEGDISELNLKPGLTAKVEIMLATLKDVLFVPISAVFTNQDVTFCYRRSHGKVERTPVAIGRSSATHVQILDGLEERDDVLLVPPRNFKTDKELEPLKVARKGQAARAASRPAPGRGAPGSKPPSGRRRPPGARRGGRRGPRP